MTPLEVLSVGALTAVGDDAPTTMAAILSEIQLFEDLDVEGSGGEPVTGGSTRMDSRTVGVERLASLGRLALQECVAGTSIKAPLPLVVCAPGPEDLRAPPGKLLERIGADGGIPLDASRSRVFTRGRAGTTEALAAALALIDDPRVPACLILGVDSLIGRRRLGRLLEERRILDADNSDGFIPSEAAVAVLLARRANTRPMAVITSFASRSAQGDEEGGTARALSGAMAQAVGIGSRDVVIGALVHDGSGRHDPLEELSFAANRAPLAGLPGLRVVAPALSTGEVGAASGVLSLAVLAFFMSHGEILSPAVATFHSDEPIRGAAVMVPPRRGSGHG